MSEKMNIDQVAQLARLYLTEDQKQKLSKNLEDILAYVEQLQTLDTSNIPATSHVLALANVFREDRVVKSNIREEVLAHAPKHEGNFFKVPKVIEDK